MKFLRKDHQWKIGHLIVGALISFIGILALFGIAGFFWLERDLEEKVVQPLLEREVNRVLDGFRSEYLAGGIFIRQMQGLLTDSPVGLHGDLRELAQFLEALARRENGAEPRFSYIQFGNKEGEFVSINLKGNGAMDFYIEDALHQHGLHHFDRRPDLAGAQLLATIKGYDPRKRPWYANATSDCPQVSPVYFSLGGDAEWNASITCPLGRAGKEQGILAVDLSTDRLQKLLDAAIQQSLISGVFILDDNNRVLLKSERLGQADRDFFLGEEDKKVKFSEAALAHLLLEEKQQLINIRLDSRGKFLIYQKPLGELGKSQSDFSRFRVVVISSRDALFSVFNNFFWLSWFALLLIILGAYMLIRVYRSSITFPLIRLRDQAKQVAFKEVVSSQEFERLYPKGRAIEEIVSVQDAVEKMANSLYSLYHELRERVDKDEESGQLSLIGAANLLQKMPWQESTVIVVEINNYVQLSDTLNRVALRLLWRGLCKRLASCWEGMPEDRVYCYRYSESRLVILMLGKQSEHQAAIGKMQREASLILATGEEEEVRVFLSFGVSVGADDRPASLDAAVSNAVLALRAAQLPNGPGFAFFHPSMLEKELRTQAVLAAMDSAAVEEEFMMFYQPICDLRSGALHGVEALMRWNSPVLGMVPPSEFIPLAERSERIAMLGSQALRKVVRDIAALRAEGALPDGFSAHVNVSARQMMHAHFFEQIREVVIEHDLPPRYITLELTESLLIDDTNHIREQFRRLGSYGFGLCLDDFGTGYSSLSTLHNFNFNCVKLDRSFIVRSTEKGRASAVLPAIVGIARSLEISCVAEGIESEEQAEILRAMGCEYVQGYLFARPMPLDELRTWMDGLGEEAAVRIRR
ncbi:EAL domain-containing protein [Herbaspirillum sp.]|uniref:bifunctional diguanylate cyclase/phosphodiesterase n=1 Tax=Herbaspirillum sp. TaxID=1890675 RepID=UPI001B05A4B7|nr:EAL domain-containing protein [Herbaspirillum sp.]MBO9538301.1 EAL domain-containing protein [Herbaspirillum sp.]